MPIGAYAEMRETKLYLRGVIAADDGTRTARGELVGDAARAEVLGAELARRLQGSAGQGTNDQKIALPDARRPRPSRASPLCGKKILITRAHGQASVFAEQIRALGGEPVEYPTIDFAPLSDFRELDNALVRVQEFDWVVFTSVNGVRFVADRLRTLGQDPLSLASAKIAAIGPATARALEQIGLHVDFVPTKFHGAQIAIELPIERGARALLLRADIASDELARGLAVRGVAVTDVDTYRTVTPARPYAKLREIDAITFTSSSTVKNLLAMLGSKRAELDHAQVFCIGPVTASTARELGLDVDAVATEHTVDGLVRTMADYYGTWTNADER
jgi:uroporphyrinogen III methyltransferase/synthase